MDIEERRAWLRLTLTEGVGAVSARELLAAFGLPTAIFAHGAAALARVVAQPVATRLATAAPPQVELAIDATERWLAGGERRAIVTLADPAYPASLFDLTDPPPLLYAEGRLELAQRPALAIVGSRSATRQGVEHAQAFAAHLARAGLTIVSGLALGIDAAAHQGALTEAAASTIAVVGTGIDIDYPAANRTLAATIRAQGLLLSELPLGTPAIAHQFPRRNRLIAGLVRGVLVVEAALRSGSLISARLAAEIGREVFAIPGSIHSPVARGCHRLIKDGAKLVESAQDVLDELRWAPPPSASAASAPTDDAALANTLHAGDHADEAAAADDPAAAERAQILSALAHDPIDLDRLIARTGLASGRLAARLLELELTQDVERLPGNCYQRLRR